MTQYDATRRIIAEEDRDALRENANMNGESFSGKMSKIGSEHARQYAKECVMPDYLRQAIDDNYVYVHDADQYALGTTNCIFIPFGELLARGFNTGNGYVRPPKRISSAMSLVAIIFQAQQNAQYGGVSANKLDWDLAPYVAMSFREHFRKAQRYFNERKPVPDDAVEMRQDRRLLHFCPRSYRYAREETVAETRQAAEALIHNLNTMSSRAGAQIPFTSINYGMCTSIEGRLVSEALLDATIAGLGNGETPIFPQHIFQCKRGVNMEPDDPNYDLFVKAIECSSRRLYPNFVNVDAPFNAQYYDPADPDTIISTMGCRTRTIADRHGPTRLSGKGNLSFNTLNLVKIALDNREQPGIAGFLTDLDYYADIAIRGLVHRYGIQARQPAKASDFMMREGVWTGGRDLAPDDEVGPLIKHGTLALGFIGLAECLVARYGKHHGEDAEVAAMGERIIARLRKACDVASEVYDLNITLFATPAEGLAGKFTQRDVADFGVIPGVTDREYYTNSFHVPVYYALPAHRKIAVEAPYHALCNAGAISYVELDGNARANPSAFARIVKYALAQNIGYFSVNHPLDRCPACGYEGVIGTACPTCGATEADVHFSRLRRVTGYLTGDYTRRFNAAKVAEVRDRVRHA